MTWLEKDIEDLVELQSEWCGAHECAECGLNTSTLKPCLEGIAQSMQFTLESIKKAQRRLEEYV